MEANNNEIDLMSIWNKIWKSKLLIIVIVLVVTIPGTLVVFLSTKNTKKVRYDFVYNFINIEHNKYLDGSDFTYQTILSKNNLEIAKNSNSIFKDIDTNSIYNNPYTSISYNKENNYYNINLSLKHFNLDNELAFEFVKTLNSILLTNVSNKNNILKIFNYFEGLDNSATSNYKDFSNMDYFEIFKIFKNQKDLIEIHFEDLFILYGNKVQVNGITFETKYYNFLDWYYNYARVNILEYEEFEYSYINNIDVAIRKASTEISRLNRELAIIEDTIAELEVLYNDTLESNNTSYLSIFTQLIHLIANKHILTNELNRQTKILNYVATQDDIDFNNNGKTLILEYNDIINDFNNHYIDYLNSNTTVKPYSNTNYTIMEPTSIKLVTMVLVLVSGLLSIVVVFVKEDITSKKNI